MLGRKSIFPSFFLPNYKTHTHENKAQQKEGMFLKSQAYEFKFVPIDLTIKS